MLREKLCQDWAAVQDYNTGREASVLLDAQGMINCASAGTTVQLPPDQKFMKSH